jgi:hypothetical protein
MRSIASLLIVTSLLLAACSGSKPPVTPTTSETTTATPTVTIAPPTLIVPTTTPGPREPQLENEHVIWRETGGLLYLGEEAEYPLSSTPDRPPFQVFSVVQGVPELVYETQRFAYETLRRADGTIDLLVYSQTPDPGRYGFDLSGLVSLTPDGKEIVRLVEEDEIYESPDLRSFLVLRNGILWMADEAGKTYVIEGLGSDPAIVSWYPDSSAFIVDTLNGIYSVPLLGDTAHRISTFNTREPRSRWSPDGKMLAFTSSRKLFIFYRTDGETRTLRDSGDYREVELIWSPDSTILSVGEELLDAATGEETFRLSPPYAEILTTGFSADGRFYYWSEMPGDPRSQPPLCAIEGRYANRTYVYDLQLQVQSKLLDCDRGFYIFAGATAGGHVLLHAPICWACDGGKGGLAVLDPETMEIRHLVDPVYRGVDVSPSPDATDFLAGGNTFRKFAGDGTLLEELAVATEDRTVLRAVWGDDGSIVLIVAPFVF